MPVADPWRLLKEAQAGGYAIGAFNMHNEETTEALLLGAVEAGAPVYLQVGRAIIPHMGLRRAFEMTKRVAEASEAQYVVHLDHGPWDEVLEAIRLGFNSIMCDYAHLELNDNIARTRRTVEICHDFGIPVEAELGRIPDAGQDVNWDEYCTDVGQAERFVRETGVDTLAISAGIVHGTVNGEVPPLDILRIEAIREATGIPLVLHGASGLSETEIAAARGAGVHKFNADTDLRHAFRSGIETVWSEGDRQLEDAMAEGRRRMVVATAEKLRQYGIAGSLAHPWVA
ncbi:MAG: class II fructose-bisphosphate aldolase [Rhodobacter sp.]|nr:class II fructose-bisphosphate aldolase [Rhodobacter sp.]MCY4167860.1 class II fructose-bisphosphate aldolase [Rhodobacter sp.]MCY4240383.1 class II fructose-bisphosphate aldolase [Rhodobacter sp.]